MTCQYVLLHTEAWLFLAFLESLLGGLLRQSRLHADSSLITKLYPAPEMAHPPFSAGHANRDKCMASCFLMLVHGHYLGDPNI
jgi:hypothetical protein